MVSRNSLLWLFSVFSISLVRAHVVLVHPTPRTDNDYLFSFEEGVCNPENTCAAFCGDPYDSTNNPVTVLQVGVPIILQWKTNVAHEPYQYRLSLNRNSGGDGQFDAAENILTTIDNANAADSTNVGPTGSFCTAVTIPESALDSCSQQAGDEPCVLQLWDLYYFVSCANVLLTSASTDGAPEKSLTPTTTPVTLPPLPAQSNTTILFQGASFEDYRVTVGFDEPQLDPVLYLNRCQQYEFVIDAPGHPFVLKTQPGLGLDNLLNIDDSENDYSASDNFPTDDSLERGSFTFRAGPNAPSEGLFYQCTLHEGMFSRIIVLDPMPNVTCAGDDEMEEMEMTPFPTIPSTAAPSILYGLGLVIGMVVAIVVITLGQ